MVSSPAIAIVGMSCRFAGCPTPGAFWNAVMGGRSLLDRPGPDLEMPFGQSSVFGRPYPKRFGQLGDLYACVPSMQTFPRQVNAGENQDLYFATQLAFDALTDAGLRPHPHEPVSGSVRLGYAPPFNASTVNWLQHTAFFEQTMEIVRRLSPDAQAADFDSVARRLRESLPVPNAASFLMGSGYRFVSWIARECGFAGAATIMDAGMLTGAATLRDAVDDLTAGHVDVALAGALTPPLSRAYVEGLAGEVDFSVRPELHPYADSQDGTIPGEGGALFVLKRREDALRDRDRIYALIRSISIGHNPADQPAGVLRAATDRAGVPVRTIGLVEGDGPGIRETETREIEILQGLWGPHAPGGPLVGLGSVKGNVGHLLRASMAAGVAKTALALWHRVLPPQVAAERPNALLSDPSSSVYLLTEPRPWLTGDSSSPRRAAVLGANFDPHDPIGSVPEGGRAAVLVLEEEPEVRA